MLVRTPNFSRYVALILFAALIPACGGGDSGGALIPTNPFVPGIAFIADRDTPGLPELFVSDLLGNAPSKRSGSIVAGAAGLIGGVSGSWWSFDNSYLAYTAQQDTLGVTELYAVSSKGAIPVRVSQPTLVAGGNVLLPKWAPSMNKLAYIADAEIDAVPELYVVNADGSNRLKVSGVLPPGSQGVSEFFWSPDSSRIGFTAQKDSAVNWGIYSVLANGTGSATLSYPSAGNSGMLSWAPNGNRIAYYFPQTATEGVSIYAADPDGGNAVRVSHQVPVGQGVFTNFSFHWGVWSPDSSRIAYSWISGGSKNLYVGMANGGGSVKINGTLPAGGDVADYHPWLPNSSRIVYVADENVNNTWEVFTALPDGTNRIRVSAPVVSGGTIGNGTSVVLSWTFDSSRVIYWGQGTTVGVIDVYSALPDTADSGIRISGTLVSGGITDVAPVLLPRFVGVTAQGDTAGISDVYVIDAGTGVRVRVSPPLSPGGIATDSLSWGGSRFTFTARTDASSPWELYSALPDGSSTLKISGSPAAPGGTTMYSPSN